jgi:hypothetical protein
MPGLAAYHPVMINTESSATRTLTIVLPESDWRALRTAEPDAIGWLQAQIRQRLAADASSTPAPRPSSPASSTAESWWGDDDY